MDIILTFIFVIATIAVLPWWALRGCEIGDGVALKAKGEIIYFNTASVYNGGG